MTTLHLITHTHWDREWYQTFQQVRLRLVHLIDGLLVLMEADPDFRYFMLDGQTIVLDDYLQVRPENEPELRRLIQEGRILIGPWHILPDEFLVSPEATLRNLLLGERTARRFGGKMMVGYIPDPFGHIGQMPQILRGFGIDTASLRRGLADEPVELNWQAPDGSTVFLAYLRDGYDNAAGLPTSEPERFVSEVKRLRNSLAPYSNANHLAGEQDNQTRASDLGRSTNENTAQTGSSVISADPKPPQASCLLLMHGTDHMEPPVDTTAAIAYASAHLGGDRLVQSTLPAYLADIRQALGGEPALTVIGELRACKRHHLLPGVLSTRMWIKQRNQACETLLELWAEPFTTWAELSLSEVEASTLSPVEAPALSEVEASTLSPVEAPALSEVEASTLSPVEESTLSPVEESTLSPVEAPAPYLQHPFSLLQSAWRLLMECHPHDSICGCSIDQVHDEMHSRFDQVEQIGEEITRQSLARLASSVDTQINQRLALVGKSSPQTINFGIIVFNPTTRSRSGLVTASFELPPDASDFEIIDDQGQVVPHQQQDGGSVDLIHMTLDRKGLQDSMSMIHEGRAANMVVRNLKWQKHGDKMLVQVIMATSGEPDLAAWKHALHESEKIFADDAIKTFVVQARTPPGSEATFVAQDVPAFGYRTYWLRDTQTVLPATLVSDKPNRAASLLLSMGRRLEKIAGPVMSKMGTQPQKSAGRYFSTAERPVQSGNPERFKANSLDYAEGVVRGKKPPYAIENEYLRVEASVEDGTVILLDKRSGAAFRGLNRFVDGGDCGDEYNYCPPDADHLVKLAFIDSIHVERGPAQQSIEIALHMRLPAELALDRKSRSKKTLVVPIQTFLELTQGVPRLDISTTVDNLAPDGSARVLDHRLRVHFPAPFSVQEADYDGHFEIVNRKLGLPAFDQSWVEQPRPEKPQRLFTAISGDEIGLAVANRGLPEVEVFNNNNGDFGDRPDLDALCGLAVAG